MGLSGAIACSFFDGLTGTVVQLNQISQESSFVLEDVFETDVDGNRRKVRERFVLELITYQEDGVEQLIKWTRDGTLLEFALAGRQENILIYRPSTITVERPFNFSSRGRSATVITMTGDAKTLPCWKGINLLSGFVKVSGFDFGWDDADNDDSADGYNVIGTGQSFVDDLQSVDTDSGNEGLVFPEDGFDFNDGIDLTRAFRFPIAGISLTMSIEAVTVPVACIQVIQTFLYGSSGTQTNRSFSSAGRQSMSITTEANTYGVHLRPMTRQFSGSVETLEMRDPALRVDGKSIYTE